MNKTKNWSFETTDKSLARRSNKKLKSQITNIINFKMDLTYTKEGHLLQKELAHDPPALCLVRDHSRDLRGLQDLISFPGMSP